jgi:xyloglucan-specific endo-beta-1,4-glucanase
MKLSLFIQLGSVALAAAAPSAVLEQRQQKSLCQQYDYWSGNGYELLNNLWGKDTATSGSQCTYLENSNNNGVTWRTTWTWQGGPNNVKSYVYIGKQISRGRTIASIKSMQTSVSWKYDTENIRANVAYDIFTAVDPNHVNSSGDYELMIWLARLGNVYPIGSSVGTVSVGGKSWDLWVGYNGSMRVYSFIATGTTYSWSGDVKQFFNYLESNQGYPASSQNLIGKSFLPNPLTGKMQE